MAEEEKKEEAAEEAKPKGGGKKKLIIIIVAVIVLIGAGVGAFLAFGSKDKKGGEEGEEAEEEATEEGDGEHGDLPGAIVPLDVFIVNLQVKGSFLKSSIQLQFSDPMPPAGFDNETPRVRDAIIRVLSTKTASEILTIEGKDKLREEIKTSVNEVLGSEEVVGVFFTEFIVQ